MPISIVNEQVQYAWEECPGTAPEPEEKTHGEGNLTLIRRSFP